MAYVFLMGFMLGLRHALDADHIAAVAAIATRARGPRETLRLGIAWGLGHAVTLFAVSLVVLGLGLGFDAGVAGALEFAVGAMLVLLGADVIRRVVRDRVHAHAHRHGPNNVHLHVHSHADEHGHADSAHAHAHPAALPGRALAVGLMHGLAGSAALLLVSVTTVEGLWNGLAYIALFGVGSMLGMAVLSLTIALPLRHGARLVTWGYNGVHAAVGAATAAFGIAVMAETGPQALAWIVAI